jgi:hypothetical protein
MQRIAQRALQPAAIHPVIRLQVSGRGLDGLTPTQPAILLRTQALVLAAVNDLLVAVVSAHAAEAKIGDDLSDRDTQALRYVCRLLQHRARGTHLSTQTT